MTFTQEYERMRPMVEDRHEYAREFTSTHPRTFDPDTYLVSQLFKRVEATPLWHDKAIQEKAWKIARSERLEKIREEKRFGLDLAEYRAKKKRERQEQQEELRRQREEEEKVKYPDFISRLQAWARDAFDLTKKSRVTCFCGVRGIYAASDGMPLCINHVQSWTRPTPYYFNPRNPYM